MLHHDYVLKIQLQIELDPTNNVERDINKNTVHSCLQLKLFEQDVGLQVCKTTKYVPTYTIQHTLNRSRAWSTMSSSEVTPPNPLSPPLVVCLKAWMWLETASSGELPLIFWLCCWQNIYKEGFCCQPQRQDCHQGDVFFWVFQSRPGQNQSLQSDLHTSSLLSICKVLLFFQVNLNGGILNLCNPHDEN